MSSPKRKQNFVDADVQGGLIRRILFHWFMFFVVTAVAVISLKTLLGDPSASLSIRFQQELGEIALLAVIFIAISPFFILDTLRFSNRFVGPVCRLRRHLQELGSDGETKDIEFRDNDFWQEIAGEFNEVNRLARQRQQKANQEENKNRPTANVV